MGAATWSDAWDQIKKRVRMWHETMRFGSQVATDYDTMHTDLLETATHTYGAGVQEEAEIARAALSSIVSPDAVLAGWEALWADLAVAVSAPGREAIFEFFLEDVYEYMISNSETVETRNLTYGSPSLAGGNVGNGSIFRVTVDENGHNLEWCGVESYTATVIEDQNLGRSIHEEVWEIVGETPSRDFLISPLKSGIVARFAALSRKRFQQFTDNPSFDQFSGTAPSAGSPTTPAATDEVTGWTLDTAANYRVGIDTPSPYRVAQGESAAKWLGFTANGTVYQQIRDNRIPRLFRRRPFILGVAVYRDNSADGTITLSLGATSQTFTVTSLNNAAWNLITLDRDKDLYYRNFREADFRLEIDWSGRTTGELYFDDLRFAPMEAFNGTWIAFIGGSNPWIEGDTASWADTEPDVDGGKNQKWAARSGMLPADTCFTLPSASPTSATIADPADG